MSLFCSGQLLTKWGQWGESISNFHLDSQTLTLAETLPWRHQDKLAPGKSLRGRRGHITTDQDSWTHDFVAPHPRQHAGLHAAALAQHDSPLPFTMVCAQHVESETT